MMKASATGRKTDQVEGLLEKQISVMSNFLEQSLAAASAMDSASDSRGWAREDAIANAVRLAKASATLGLAVSKLRGEFTHRMVFRKEEPVAVAELPPPDAAPLPPPYGRTTSFHRRGMEERHAHKRKAVAPLRSAIG